MKSIGRLRDFISARILRSSVISYRRSSRTSTIQMSIGRLPTEILSVIFSLIAHDPTANPVSFAAITHVCTRWRQIALANGSLWNRVVLTYPMSPHHLAYALTWLQRSASAPIDIFLDLRDPSWDWNEDTHNFRWQEMEPIMRIFLPHVHRWRRFELLTDTWAPIFTFLWYTRHVTSAPLLETVSLSRCNLYFAARGQVFQPTSLRQPIQFFRGANLERLTSVSLVGVHIQWNQPSSLRNLTVLELKFHASDVMPNLQQFTTIIEACPGLIHLAIFGWGPVLDVSSPVVGCRLRLSNLKKLSFGFLDTPYAIQLLSLFDLPLLDEFVLEDIGKVVSPLEVEDATNLLLWLSSSALVDTSPTSVTRAEGNDLSRYGPSTLPLANIHSLELHGIRLVNSAAVEYFFRRLTSLTRLTLYDDVNNVLRVLGVPIGGASQPLPLLPLLEEIRCQDMDADVLLNVVTSRASADSLLSLKKVSLEFARTSALEAGSLAHTRLVSAGIEVFGRSETSGSDSDYQMSL
ncbi:hypothetical protein M413DRAFT_271167 [Hebeloma cylindrosporum]|uniref:F-box domain-containing protein n=1 Tax=Hebeloma cylindrosporum TaxID=76867 RepID=A0A0C2YBK1_HEBCY|nr:hypothetical protein M413DRAFT_271167 [Hebeloma cylindrosporum h7]